MNLTIRSALLLTFVFVMAHLVSIVVGGLYKDLTGYIVNANFLAAIVLNIVIVLGIFNLSKLENFIIAEYDIKSVKNILKNGFSYFALILISAVAVGFISKFILEDVLNITPELQPAVQLLLDASSFNTYLLAALAVGVFAPIGEELLFRAVLFTSFKSKMRTSVAMIISSFIFALVHISLANFAALFVVGLLFCIAYEKCRDIRVPMIAHSLFNFFNFFFILFFEKSDF